MARWNPEASAASPERARPGRLTHWPLPASGAWPIASFSLPRFRRKLCAKGKTDPGESIQPEVASFPEKERGENRHQKVGELMSGVGHANFAKSGSQVRVFTFPSQEACLCALLGLSHLYN